MANYRYQPLDTRKQDIRLIRLKSAVPDISADCDIATFPIRTAPPYIALSYTWDSDDVPKTPIKIDDQELEIGQTVRDFLFHLEDPAIDVQQALYREFQMGMRCVWDLSLLRSRLAMPTRETWLWIDQICIDQASTVEKNHQVPLMSKIYSRCEFVISWLGARPLDLELIPNCRYFSRLWILQEILLAPFAFILCRKTWISMMDRNWRGTLSFDSSGLSRIHTLAPYSFPIHTLDWVLEKFAWNECKDPRDKVYGLLGLFIGRDHIPTDYAKSTTEIVCDVLHVTLNETNDPLSASLGEMPFRVPLGTAILAEQFGISATRMTQLWRDLEERKEFGLPFDVEYLQELARRLEIIENQS